MSYYTIATILLSLTVMSGACADKNIYDFSAIDIDGNTVSMDKYRNKVLLIVNVASQCGYTDSNYKGLQALYDKYRDIGLDIAAFPCNQFGRQEPWKENEIKKWVDENYSITFDMYSKVNVKGNEIEPMFQFLIESNANNNKPIEWNFDGKFLVNKNGKIVKRWTNITPLSAIASFIGTGQKSEL